MSSKTITLTGGKAVLVLILLAGILAFRVMTARAKIDTQARAALETWVQNELIRPILADTGRSLAERGAAIEQATTVRIQSLAVRGSLSNAVVRVELAPNPALPKGTALTRYYRMRYSQILGWQHKGRSNVVSWYLAALTFR